MWSLLHEAFTNWNAHKVPKMGAALAYYAAFSLAPLVVIVLSLTSLVVDRAAARAQLTEQVVSLVGQDGAKVIDVVLANSSSSKKGFAGTIIGFVILLAGASGVFGELQDSLNQIWEVPAKSGQSIWRIIKDRFLSFSMVFAIGFLLFVSLLATAAIQAAGKFVGTYLATPSALLELANFAVSMLVITFLFALIFRILPDVFVAWRDVWLGAVVTAFLFVLGKLLLGLYIAHSAVASSYGAAGSFVVILIWVFYSAQILFFGAELTRVYALRHGSQKPAGV